MKIIDRKKEAVVYKLFSGDSLIYIGQTVNLQSRLDDHSKNKVFDKVEYFYIDKEDVDCVEAYLIMEHNPPQNKSVRSVLFSAGRDAFAKKYSECVPHIIQDCCSKFLGEPVNCLDDFDAVGEETLITDAENCLSIPTNLSGGCFVENVSTGHSVRLSYLDILVIATMQKIGEPATQDYIASESRVDRKTVNRLISKLTKIGYKISDEFNFTALLADGFNVFSVKKLPAAATRCRKRSSTRS